uniref:Uncharacterized protein n=1 Tax=Anguilla anguilla TaxID=7936 RepID=A0A0E9WY20_ANGAN
MGTSEFGIHVCFLSFIGFCAGQGCQIPSDSDRKQNPQTGPLLQDQESTPTQLEVVRIATFISVLAVRVFFWCIHLLFSELVRSMPVSVNMIWLSVWYVIH